MIAAPGRNKVRYKRDEVARAAVGRGREILHAVAGIDPQLLDGRNHPCPLCGGTDRFRMIDPNAGAVFCNQCFATGNGDALAAVMWARNMAFPEALAAVGEFLNVHPEPSFEIVATYDFRRADGELAYQVCRLNPKSFRQRKPEGNGWTWRVKGLAPLPYRLPELVNSHPQTVFVVEGEKDADRLAALGLVATCNSGGAGKWSKIRPESLEVFAGREVVILPDNDEPGEKHAADIVKSLAGLADEIRVVRLPGLEEKEDVSDWLDAGNTVAELLELVEQTPLAELTEAEEVPEAIEEGDEPHALTDPRNQTELANSQRFVKAFGDSVRYVPTWGRFLVWESGRWVMDPGEVQTLKFAKSIAKDVWESARACPTSDVIKFYRHTASRSGCRAMIDLAATELVAAHDGLDRDGWLLNCPNGTVDLRNGELRAHRRDDLLTKQTTVDFVPDAKAPLWDKFLADVFPDLAVREFFARLVGYCLTGDVSEHVLPIAFGGGSNGKSTALTTIQRILGDYSAQAPASLLMVNKSEQHPTEIAGLFGRRLVVASETNMNGRLNEGLVKSLTGGDVITARRMREDFWEFLPTHKLILATNHRPVVQGTDHGIWRRLLLIPFEQCFEGKRKDPRLAAKLVGESSGILAWAVRGCLAWQTEGLNPPPAVQAATQEYKADEDVIGRFIADECLTGRTAYKVKFSDLYAVAERWAEETGDSIPSKRAVGKWLKAKGFQELRNNGMWYCGVALRVERTERNERNAVSG